MDAHLNLLDLPCQVVTTAYGSRAPVRLMEMATRNQGQCSVSP